jgi:hypothetical protein
MQDVRSSPKQWRGLQYRAKEGWAEKGSMVWQHHGGLPHPLTGKPFEEASMVAEGELARRAGAQLRDPRNWGR